jgi:hypothetical protein
MLVGTRRQHAQRPSISRQFTARGQTLGSVGPEVHEDLTLEALRFDDPPDFERGALGGAHD